MAGCLNDEGDRFCNGPLGSLCDPPERPPNRANAGIIVHLVKVISQNRSTTTTIHTLLRVPSKSEHMQVQREEGFGRVPVGAQMYSMSAQSGLLVGFDIRGKQSPDVVWNEERKSRYLLRDDIQCPLSADQMVWPSCFPEPMGKEWRGVLGHWTDLGGNVSCRGT